mgnify:CR=1 FL=1
MLKLNYNPIAKRWHERVDSLPKDKIELINAPIGKENLIVLKKSNKKIQDGDVFVVSFKEGIYFWGKVIEAYINHPTDNWMNGCCVIFIFKCKSKTKDIKEFKPDYNNLLTEPNIVTPDYWKKGLIETVGNIPLTEEEKTLDYGFFDGDFIGEGGTFKKANGELLDHMPKISAIYGIKTYVGLYMDIKTEVIIDSSLLE